MSGRNTALKTRYDDLQAHLTTAFGGDPYPLYQFLARHSSLPSPRANETLLLEVGDAFGTKGPKGDTLAIQMATLDADMARGGTEFEFVPMAGVMALGVRASKRDKSYDKLLATLHACAEDLRFRVRDTVPLALARIGSTQGDALVADVASWTDGLFHAAAVLRGLSQPEWLTAIHDVGPVVDRLQEAFETLANAPRSAVRYPGYKALVDAFAVAPGLCAARFGVPVFDALVRWSSIKEPILREAIAKNVEGSRLAGRFAPEITRLKQALAATEPVPRDPRSIVGPTRGRGKDRSLRRK